MLQKNTFVWARSNSPQRRRRRLPSESNPMAHVDQEQTSNLASSRRSQDGRTSSSAGSSWASLHADDFGFVLNDNEVCACLSQVSQDSAQTGCRDAAAASTSSRGRASTTTPPSAEETAMKSRSDSISSQALTPKRSSRDCRSTISSTPKPRHALLHQGKFLCPHFRRGCARLAEAPDFSACQRALDLPPSAPSP